MPNTGPVFAVVDDYLPEPLFWELANVFENGIDDFPWFLAGRLNLNQPDDSLDTYFYHTSYNTTVNSPWHSSLSSLLESFKMRALIRAKFNCYPNNTTLTEHAMHRDYDFPHQAAVFSLNTCDGYTKFADGTKVESVANRIVFFDGSAEHCSTNCTTEKVRLNINFNYL
jgi:hypothetical protein